MAGRLDSATTVLLVDSRVKLPLATYWEISIKRAIGRLEVVNRDLLAAVGEGGFQELPIQAKHVLLAGDLPRHHDDPFDRMLIAQAMGEGLTLMTGDGVLHQYGVTVLEA